MFLVDKEKVCTFYLHFHKMLNFKWYICFQVPVNETENDGITGKEKNEWIKNICFFFFFKLLWIEQKNVFLSTWRRKDFTLCEHIKDKI